jgi:hypothetical protein
VRPGSDHSRRVVGMHVRRIANEVRFLLHDEGSVAVAIIDLHLELLASILLEVVEPPEPFPNYRMAAMLSW